MLYITRVQNLVIKKTKYGKILSPLVASDVVAMHLF